MSSSSSLIDSRDVSGHVKKWIDEGYSNSAISHKIKEIFNLNTSEASIRRFKKRHKIKDISTSQTEEAFTEVKGEVAQGATSPSTIPLRLDDEKAILTEVGLDPETWTITHVTNKRWEGPNSAKAVDNGGPAKITYYQTNWSAKKIKPDVQIIAPRTDGWVKPKSINPKTSKGLFVVVGDQQAPFHDRGLHQAFVSWIETNKPEKGFIIGDSIDIPDISRHRIDPANNAAVNECLQSGYDMFRDYVTASLSTKWQKLIGNHDERIINLLIDQPKNNALIGLKRPDTPDARGEEVLSLSHLMRIDEIGIELVDPHGAYDLGQINITDKIAVRHGWLARKGAGATALATIEHLGYSVIVGHVHRQGLVSKTKHEIDGAVRTIIGVEAGCMCRVDQKVGEDNRIWPNYTPAPDWQQGFATVQVWDDGTFKVDLATFVNGKLIWRDQQYQTK